MSEVTLKAETGRITGSRPSRRLRAENKVPGVVYGLGGDAVSVLVDRRDLRLALTTDAGVNALLDLEVDGAMELAVVKDIQRHPVRRDVAHIDFLRVDRNATIDVDIPIHLEGEASLVTQEDGIAEQRLMTVTVSVKPADIPDSITVDISEMTMDRTITVGDLELPPGVLLVSDPEQAVVTAELTRAALAEDDEGEEGEGEGEGEEGAEREASGDDAEAASGGTGDSEG